jgi:hypothetical protein
VSVLKKIFDPEKLVNSTIKGIDKAVFTNEEKSDNFNKLLKLYEPYKITQRYISLIVTLPFMFMFLVGGLLWVYLYFTGSDKNDVYQLWHYMNEVVGVEFKLILGFYFAGGVLEGTVNKLKKKDNG